MIAILRLIGVTNIAAGIRHHARRPVTGQTRKCLINGAEPLSTWLIAGVVGMEAGSGEGVKLLVDGLSTKTTLSARSFACLSTQPDNRQADPWLVAHVIVQNTRALIPLVAVQPVYSTRSRRPR